MRCSSNMKPRFRAEWVVVREELLILASCLLRPMSRNSVLGELSTHHSHHSPLPRSFTPGLNLPFLHILTTVIAFFVFFFCLLRVFFFLFFGTDSTNSPDCLPILLSTSIFVFSFFFFPIISSWFRARQIKLTYASFQAHVKLVYRIVSYRVVFCVADVNLSAEPKPMRSTCRKRRLSVAGASQAGWFVRLLH